MNIPLQLPKFAILGCDCLGYSLSANQIVRCFKLKKLKNYMRYQVEFLLPLKLHKIYYFGLCRKILLANHFAGFFTFDLFDFFDLLILIPVVHCCIVLVMFLIQAFLWIYLGIRKYCCSLDSVSIARSKFQRCYAIIRWGRRNQS